MLRNNHFIFRRGMFLTQCIFLYVVDIIVTHENSLSVCLEYNVWDILGNILKSKSNMRVNECINLSIKNNTEKSSQQILDLQKD